MFLIPGLYVHAINVWHTSIKNVNKKNQRYFVFFLFYKIIFSKKFFYKNMLLIQILLYIMILFYIFLEFDNNFGVYCFYNIITVI